LAGRPKDDIVPQFVEDTMTMTTAELSGKYKIAESTVRDWRLFCKRSLDLEVGYGVPKMHFLDKKEDPGPMDDEDVWALMARMSAQRDMERKAQDHLTVVLDEPLPHAIALTGDWHIGMEGVLYDEMDQDFDALAGLPGLLALGMGDYAHNPKVRTKPGESLYRMILPDPDQQYRMALHQAQKLAGQWYLLKK
jgi:hypothetical protein